MFKTECCVSFCFICRREFIFYTVMVPPVHKVVSDILATCNIQLLDGFTWLCLVVEIRDWIIFFTVIKQQ